MSNRKIKTYLAITISFILVTQFNTVRTFFTHTDFPAFFASFSKPFPSPGIQTHLSFERLSPTVVLVAQNPTGAMFTPTAVVQPTTSKKISSPTQIVKKIPTTIPTLIPTIKKSAPIKTQQSSSSSNKTSVNTAVSGSKLGMFMIGSFTGGARQILEQNPHIIKVIDPWTDGGFLSAIRSYKQRNPTGVAVVRFYEADSRGFGLGDDPSGAAQEFFNKVVSPGLNHLGGDKNLFDYLQSPNEFDSTPPWKGEQNMKWNGAFWRKLTELNNNAGIKTCIAGIPVGNIDASEFGYILDDMKAMNQMGAAFCYHGYAFDYNKDVNNEIYYSLRYRQFYDYFRQNASELTNMPLILSEGGVAEGGDPKAGYLKSGRTEEYESWLTWFDQELQKDPYVVGVTLYQIGNNSDWGYFNLDPIAGWLADYIKAK